MLYYFYASTIKMSVSVRYATADPEQVRGLIASEIINGCTTAPRTDAVRLVLRGDDGAGAVVYLDRVPATGIISRLRSTRFARWRVSADCVAERLPD